MAFQDGENTQSTTIICKVGQENPSGNLLKFPVMLFDPDFQKCFYDLFKKLSFFFYLYPVYYKELNPKKLFLGHSHDLNKGKL